MLTGVLLLTASELMAQVAAGDLALKTYTPPALGLTSPPTRLLIDTKGFLWIGSTTGVACFDGSHTVSYTDADGLTGSFVTDLEMDRDGVVYAATQKGISRFTGNPARPFEPLSDLSDIFFITSILPLSRDTVLLGDLKYSGIHRWVRGKLDAPYPGTGISDRSVTDIAYHNGAVYFIGSNYLFTMRGGAASDSVRIRPNAKHWGTLTTGAGKLWCAAAQLYQAGAGRRPDSIPMPPLTENILTMVLALPDGRLLAGNTLLWEYRNNKWDTLLGPEYFNGQISYMAHEGADVIWAAGSFGLMRIAAAKGAAGYPYSAFYTFTRPDGRLLGAIGPLPGYTEANALRILKPAPQQIYHDRDGRHWYLTASGLYRLAGNTLKAYGLRLQDADVVPSYNTAIEDKTGRLWFGTDRSLTYLAGEQLVPARVLSDLNGKPFGLSIRYLANGPGNNLFAGSSETAFMIAEDMPGQFTGHSFRMRTMLNCTSLAGNSRGELWGCTDGVIRRLELRGRNREVISTDSLPQGPGSRANAYIETIAFDGHDNLWVLDRNQLLIYLRQQSAGTYPTAPSLIFTANNYPAFLTGNNAGKIYAAADGGITVTRNGKAFRLDAAAIIAAGLREAPPRLSLTGLQQNGRSVPWDSAGYTLSGGLPVRPAFEDSVRQISFRLAAVTPSVNPEFITYEYQLDGFDRRWSSNGTSNILSFTGLRPGNYTLRVRAADLNGRYSNTIAYPFSVLPPWYLTWWAWTVWSALGLALIALLFFLRLRTLQRRERIERLVIEQQLKALRAQINPHFLQNTFDFLSRSLEEQPVAQSQQVIEQLSAYLRNVLDRSDEQVVTLEDELEFAAEYLAINQLLFYNGFVYEIEISPHTDTFGIKLPAMLLQPLLENALKHGAVRGGTSPGRIRIRVYNDEDQAYCIISNPLPATTGRTLRNHTPKGLAITRQRLALLHRKATWEPDIRLESDAGEYRVIIVLPLVF